MNCRDFQIAMPDLLFDPVSTPYEVEGHLADCAACRSELASFQATFAVLDSWDVPEPSAFFDQKLAVRLREEASNPPAGWFERLHTRLLFNTGRQFRPALAGVMALVLVLGVCGGTVASLPSHVAKTQVSAAVGDLQILDKNDQALQQMDQLIQGDDSADQAGAPPRT